MLHNDIFVSCWQDAHEDMLKNHINYGVSFQLNLCRVVKIMQNMVERQHGVFRLSS